MKQPYYFSLVLLITLIIIGRPLSSQTTEKKYLSPTIHIVHLDSLFRVAINSPGYLVIKKSEYEQAKQQIKRDMETSVSKLKSLEEENSRLQDSLNRITAEEAYEKHMPIAQVSPESPLLSPWSLLVIFPLIIISCFSSFRYMRNRQELKTTNEQVMSLTADFENCKRNKVEKERKLVREIIDLRNELENVKSSN